MPSTAARPGRVRIRKRRRLGRALRFVIIAAIVGWGLFLANYFYRENAVSDQRAVADCIEEHNRSAVGSDGEEASVIAALCAQSKPAKP